MIEYMLLFLAVVCFAGQFAFTKCYERKIEQTAATSLALLFVMSLVGALVCAVVGGFSLSFSYPSFIYAGLFAAVMIPYYMLGIKALSLGSLAIYSMFMMLGGMLVPFFYGVIFLSETPSPFMVAGSIILTVLIVVQALLDKDPLERERKRPLREKLFFYLLCVAIFLINGLTGVIAKAHQMDAAAVDEASFTVISCVMTAFFSLVLLIPKLIKSGKESTRSTVRALTRPLPLLLMAGLGAVGQVGNVFHLKAAATLPASVQFPIVSGGVIVLSALASAFIFREKLSKATWIVTGAVFLATFLFAF